MMWFYIPLFEKTNLQEGKFRKILIPLCATCQKSLFMVCQSSLQFLTFLQIEDLLWISQQKRR